MLLSNAGDPHIAEPIGGKALRKAQRAAPLPRRLGAWLYRPSVPS